MNYNILQYRIKQIIQRNFLGKPEPFLCIITPIFNPALKSLRGLVEDLQKQTNKNFIHVIIANGQEEKILKYIEHVRVSDKRFVYDEIPFDDRYKKSKKVEDVLSLNGIRRNFVMMKYDAKMYLNLGADFRITDDRIIEKLQSFFEESKKDIILLESNIKGDRYPLYPINKHSHIDLTNYCYSKKIARKYKYPEDVDPKFDVANDYRYFNKIINFKILEGSYGVKDGRNTYKSIEDLYHEQLKTK